MKNLFTSKLLVLAVVLLGWTYSANSQNYKTVKKWDFTSWSEETLANLAADAASASPSWYCHEYDEDGEPRRYKNWGNSKEILVANGVEIEETKGILFPSGLTGGAMADGEPNNKGDLSLRFNFGDNGIQSGSSNKWVTIKDRTVGQKVIVVLKSASGSDARGIAALDKMSGTVGTATYKDGSEENTYELLVTESGNVRFQYNGGVILKSITVQEEGSSDEPRIAFVYDSNYAAHDLENRDPIYEALKDNYNVTLWDINGLDASTVVNLIDFDLVYAAEAIAGNSAYGNALKEIVNLVPMLNQKSYHYTYDSSASKNRWGWAAPQNLTGTTYITVEEASRNHPIFDGVEIDEDGVCQLFTGEVTNKNLIQGYKDPREEIVNDLVLAKLGDYNAIHQRGTGENIYMLVPLASDALETLNDNGLKLVMNAVEYVLASKGAPEVKIVEKPEISYTQNGDLVKITITSTTEEADIYYTLDGSTPTAESNVYTEPFDIDELRPTTVKAIAMKEGWLNSEIATEVVTNENYVPREKELLWIDFNESPEDWRPGNADGNIDLFGTGGGTGSVDRAGVTVSSVGCRITLMGKTSTGGDYAPYTDEDQGATNKTMQMSKGTSAFITTTKAYQGPFDISVWWCSTDGKAETLKVYASTDLDAEEWEEIGSMTNSVTKRLRKYTVEYNETETVYLRVGVPELVSKVDIFDIKVLGEGDEDPASVAYVYKRGYGSWEKENDPIYQALASNYIVTDFDMAQLEADEVSTADYLAQLEKFDLVYSSEAAQSSETYGRALVDIVNKVPMLNQKAFYYANWKWGAGANPAKGTTSVTVEEEYLAHPIFEGVTVEDGVVEIFGESNTTYNQMQAYTSSQSYPFDKVLAKVGDNNGIHERGTKNTYMLIPISSDNIENVSENGVQLVLNAAEYLIATKDKYSYTAKPTISYTVSDDAKEATISLSCDTPGAIIFYTLDGSTPTYASNIYDGEEITVMQDVKINAFAVSENTLPSDVVSDVIYLDAAPRGNEMLWVNFNDQPADWREGEPSSENIELSPSGGTVSVERAGGFIVESQSLRMLLMQTKSADSGDYGPLTEEDAGASNYSMQFNGANGAGYITTPDLYQGPFDITVWWCSVEGRTETVTAFVKTEGGEWQEVGSVSTSDKKRMRKQTIAYNGTDRVYVKIGSKNVVNKFDIFDFKLFGEGISAPVITWDEDEYYVKITSDLGDEADIYYTKDGVDPTTSSERYTGPFQVTEKTTIKAIAVKGEYVSGVATYEVPGALSINGESINKEVSSRSYYTIGGVELAQPVKGVNILRTVYEDGSVEINKVVIK